MTRPTSPVMRRTVTGLTLSAAALVGIVLHEGYTDRAVIPVKGDVPTIGFGTTTGVKLGDTTTPPKALARALTDVQQFEGSLKQCVTEPAFRAPLATGRANSGPPRSGQLPR